MKDFLIDYNRLINGAGLVDFRDWTLIEVRGGDRAAFLHNMCTNEIRKLTPSAGREAFFTTAQGKIIAHGHVFCHLDYLLISTAPRQAHRLMAHLDRYVVREDVQLVDRTEDRRQWLVAGPKAPLCLTDAGAVEPSNLQFSHVDTTVDRIPVVVRRVDFVHPTNFLVECNAEDAYKVRVALELAGAAAVSEKSYDAARIEAGTPLYGKDITEANLPQELARDDRAISFTKGCYLGQETVARIDALGHVNKTLVGVQFGGKEVPPAGLELTEQGKNVGHVTSAAISPKLDAPLALAYVRRGSNTPGVKLQSELGEAVVVQLPL